MGSFAPGPERKTKDPEGFLHSFKTSMGHLQHTLFRPEL